MPSKEEIQRIYNAEWFEHHAGLRDAYHEVANVIIETITFIGDRVDRVLDVGCGAAFILERFDQRGGENISIRGIDGSVDCLTVAPRHLHDRIALLDITSPNLGVVLQKADLVICTEVAEHIDARYADRLVALLAAVTTHYLIFSAATPGQGGHDHINEQPIEYWLERFARFGILPADASCDPAQRRSEEMRAKLAERVPNMPWFGRTTHMLVREEKA